MAAAVLLLQAKRRAAATHAAHTRQESSGCWTRAEIGGPAIRSHTGPAGACERPAPRRSWRHCWGAALMQSNERRQPDGHRGKGHKGPERSCAVRSWPAEQAAQRKASQVQPGSGGVCHQGCSTSYGVSQQLERAPKGRAVRSVKRIKAVGRERSIRFCCVRCPLRMHAQQAPPAMLGNARQGLQEECVCDRGRGLRRSTGDWHCALIGCPGHAGKVAGFP